jgi:hypothetical protein
MMGLFRFVLAVLASPFKSKVRLEAENAVLRHQLVVLRRALHGRVRLTNHDRWFLVQMAAAMNGIAPHGGLIPYGGTFLCFSDYSAVVSMPSRLLFEDQDAAYKKEVLGTNRARVAVEAAVELGWERYIGLEGRFVGMQDFGASGKIADVYKKFDINAEAVVRAAHQTLAEVAAL